MLQYFLTSLLSNTQRVISPNFVLLRRCVVNIRKELSALQPLLLGPALQLGGALPTGTERHTVLTETTLSHDR